MKKGKNLENEYHAYGDSSTNCLRLIITEKYMLLSKKHHFLDIFMTKKEQKHTFYKKNTSNTFLHAENAFLDLENIIIYILQAIVLCKFMTHCEEMHILAAIFKNGYCTDPNRDCR